MQTRRHAYNVNAGLVPAQNQKPSPQTPLQVTNHPSPKPSPETSQASSPQSPSPENQNQTRQPSSENENNVNKKLRELYDDITKTPSFSAKINEFLRKHKLHSKHRRIVKRTFPRRRVIARYPCEIFMADLIEYPKYKTLNKGYVYILLLIDCFTKKIFLAPMKKKDKEHSATAFETIFKDFDRYPVHIITDGGKEFFQFFCV